MGYANIVSDFFSLLKDIKQLASRVSHLEQDLKADEAILKSLTALLNEHNERLHDLEAEKDQK